MQIDCYSNIAMSGQQYVLDPYCLSGPLISDPSYLRSYFSENWWKIYLDTRGESLNNLHFEELNKKNLFDYPCHGTELEPHDKFIVPLNRDVTKKKRVGECNVCHQKYSSAIDGFGYNK